jgi:predicted DNA-binding transcriptional regulator AlpA
MTMDGLTMTRDEVAAALGISGQALTNRISRRQPHPPFVPLSPRRRVWLRDEVQAWLRERQQASRQLSPYERIGLSARKLRPSSA